MKKISALGEFGLIKEFRYLAKIGSDVIKGIGDDTAILKYNAKENLLLTTDMIVEDVHFKRSMSAQLIGHKAMACNISDIAAMGGTPKFAVVSIGLPKNLSVKYINDIYKGLLKTARQFGVSVVGGDTTRSQKLVINIALTGIVFKNHVVRRDGAKTGDVILISGQLGNSLKSQHHLKFTPRLKESQYLVEHFKINSMIDISDGLAGDLGHILEESKLGAILFEELVPLRAGAKIKNALHDGEDFELLWTMSKEEFKKLEDKKPPFKYFPIGFLTNGTVQLNLVNQKDEVRTIPLKGFVHF
jgi:thiamine-monophosphate kinase